MGRRSPVLGYNHNVRYRGLVFHVQTEDSGIVNPHLFTHLFHGGVIVSTRKLVYDPDADDGVVKSLMQAQHKAVMKELRRGLFDDKIDQNLAGTPGLLPRGAVEMTSDDAAATTPNAAPELTLESIVDPGSSPVVHIVPELRSGPNVADGVPSAEASDIESAPIELLVEEEPSAPEIHVTVHPNMTPPGVPVVQVGGDATTPTPASDTRTTLPGPAGAPRRSSTPPPMSSASLPPIPSRAAPARTATPRQQQSMTPPQVVTRPITRETAATAPPSEVADTDGVEIHSPAPGSAILPSTEAANEYRIRRGERGMRDEVQTSRIAQQRAAETNAPGRSKTGAVPIIDAAAKPGTGPQRASPEAEPRAAATPRPEVRIQPRSGAPAQTEPPSGRDTALPRAATPPPIPRAATPPPIPVEPARTASPVEPARTARTASPVEPARTARTASPVEPARTASPVEPARTASPVEPARTASPVEPARTASPAPSRGTPPENATPVPSSSPRTPGGRTRTPTAPRPFAAAPPTRAAAPSAVPTTAAQRARGGSGGVVMSRPAVIVGGRTQHPTPGPSAPPPTGPATAAPPAARTQTGGGARVRRAREDVAGRGVFGQDLISEKSLDEVILAYLSEDANEDP